MIAIPELGMPFDEFVEVDRLVTVDLDEATKLTGLGVFLAGECVIECYQELFGSEAFFYRNDERVGWGLLVGCCTFSDIVCWGVGKWQEAVNLQEERLEEVDDTAEECGGPLKEAARELLDLSEGVLDAHS